MGSWLRRNGKVSGTLTLGHTWLKGLASSFMGPGIIYGPTYIWITTRTLLQATVKKGKATWILTARTLIKGLASWGPRIRHHTWMRAEFRLLVKELSAGSWLVALVQPPDKVSTAATTRDTRSLEPGPRSTHRANRSACRERNVGQRIASVTMHLM